MIVTLWSIVASIFGEFVLFIPNSFATETFSSGLEIEYKIEMSEIVNKSTYAQNGTC